ncbi:MAG: class I SAM-dependent methyltransferase [bacterium]|nr:class I SAM-dependent methyltransferase [bacterium]
MRQPQTGFDTERLRKQYLARRQFTKLKKTYSSNFPEIEDGNTPQFWEEKFTDAQAETFPMARDRNQTVVSLMQAGSNILNLGSGKGFLEALVWKKFADEVVLTGTDFTTKSLKKLKKQYPSYHFLQADLFKLPFKKNAFDTVCLIEVLEHISPQKTFTVLKELHRVVSPNGRVFLSVPINEGLEEMMPSNPNAHVRVYSEELLRFEVETAGFRVESIYRFTAFGSYYRLKKLVNGFFHLRQPNNLLFVLRK